MNLIRLNKWRALSALAFCLMTVKPATADVLFSNLGQTGGGGSISFDAAGDPIASDFLTGGTPGTITGATVTMLNTSLALTLDVTLGIYTDNGSGQPGILFQAFDTHISVPAGGSGLFTATSSGINLQPGTLYWMVGQANSEDFGGTLYWNYVTTDATDGGSYSTVPGTQVMSKGPAGLNWSDVDTGNLRFSLEGITPAPEPGTLTLLALGAAAIAGCGWQRRRAGRGRNLL